MLLRIFIFCAYMHIIINSVTCQQNDYLSINGHQKTKETSKFNNFTKGIGIERYTQFTTVTLIMKKVPKQAYVILSSKITVSNKFNTDQNLQFTESTN